MKVAIFGGAGNLGSEIAKFILDNYPHAYVTAIDNLSTGSMDKIRYLHSNPRFNFYLGSIEDIYFVELVIAESTHVINCVDTYDKDHLVSTVIQGNQNIFDCLSPEQKYIQFGFYNSIVDVDLHNACHLSAKLLLEAYNFDNKFHAKNAIGLLPHDWQSVLPKHL